ncbi:MAG: iron response transcriptional regulator IrrA [Pseudomonadota bacterium]
MSEHTETALKWLEKGDIRPTKQRITLANYLVGDGRNRHVSAEHLHNSVVSSDDAVSLATIYNTLKLFSEAGLIKEITVDGSKSYFDTRLDDHPHFFCEEEALLSDAPADSVKFESIPEAPEGYEISKVDVVIRLRKSDAS